MSSAWWTLLIAVVVEVFGTTALKYSDGFKNIPWAFGCILSYCFAFYAMAVAVKSIPLGVAYAVWAGLGTIASAIVGVWFFDEPTGWGFVLGAILIIVGVFVLNFGRATGL